MNPGVKPVLSPLPSRGGSWSGLSISRSVYDCKAKVRKDDEKEYINMADNEKYYYIKLKDSYFEQDNIKVLESMKNGHIYSLIIIKLYLKASKTDGQLMMTQRIPYDPNNVNILANVIGHDVDHVKEAIRLGVELDLMRVIEGREIWMTEIQNMIGQSSTEADRIRSYRKKLDAKALPESKDVQMYDKCTPEIERPIVTGKQIGRAHV